MMQMMLWDCSESERVAGSGGFTIPSLCDCVYDADGVCERCGHERDA